MKKSETTSRKILDTVKELLKTRENITIKDICDKAYINSAAVNYHFGDKDTLINMAVSEIFAELKQQIEVMADNEFESTEQALYTFADLCYNFAAEYSGAVKYMLTSATFEHGNSILQQFLQDKKFTDFVIEKFQQLNPTVDRVQLMCKYIMTLSVFLFPMICQTPFLKEGTLSLKNSEFKKAYINQMVKILTE